VICEPCEIAKRMPWTAEYIARLFEVPLSVTTTYFELSLKCREQHGKCEHGSCECDHEIWIDSDLFKL
jgi:hypothetical protein